MPNPGDFDVREVASSTRLNRLLKMAGSGARIGSPPAVGSSSGFIVQAGSSVTTTNAAGGFAIGFATSFPNGLACVVAMVGDTTPTQTLGLTLISANITLGAFQGILWSGTAAQANATFRSDWFAIGW